MPSLADLVIRPMHADDHDFVLGLSARVFAPFAMDPVALTLSMIDDPGAEAAVAELGRAPAGFVVIQFEQHPRDFGPWARPVIGRLNAIAVRPELSGRGIGGRLLAHAERLAGRRGAVTISLQTARTNMRARALFMSAGFVPLVPIQRAYAKRQTAIAMLKALSPG